MFDLILALIILPVFVASAICYRSWLKFNESKIMFSKREAELEEEFEFMFRQKGEETCPDKNHLKFNYRKEL